MKLDRVDVKLAGGYDIPFPRMVKIEQHFKKDRIENVEETVRSETRQKLKPSDFKGKRIAVTVGSRGIAHLNLILRTIIEELKNWDAKPFIVPAMGSHGGADKRGQQEILAGYGITEKSMGAPVVSSMDVIRVATLKNGMPVYCDKVAYESDGIVVMNRIKPHTDFKGDNESGLLKMIGIGLGNHRGATALHSYGFDQMAQLLPQVGEAFIKNAPVAFGVAIVENAYDELLKLEVVKPARFISREKELLVLAKENIARLLVSSIDVLIIEEIGKEISGSGMDPNVTGFPGSGLTKGFDTPPIQRIVVLGVTQKSHGNGIGIGLADISTIRCVNQIDWSITYINSLTAGVTEPAKMPVVMNTDKEALVVAVKTCSRVMPQEAKIVRIKNTLEIHKIEVSKPYLQELRARDDISILSEPRPLRFSEDGWLL